MTYNKIHSNNPYASRAGEYYRQQREKNENKYKCDIEGCAAAFYVKSQLDAHKLKHTGEAPFACFDCEYKTKQKFLLDKHREKEHNIPLPSTRQSRYKFRTKLQNCCGCTRITFYTNKKSKKGGRVQERIKLYKQNADILSLLINNLISKKEFSMDKRAGYIEDKWMLFPLSQPARLTPSGTSRRKTEKITSFINQIQNITKQTKKTEEFNREYQSLIDDNTKSSNLITIAYNIHKQFKTHY